MGDAAEGRMDEILQHVDEVQEALAANIRMFRAYHRLTQGELAQRCHVSRSYLADIERGEANPRLRIVGRIAAGFNLDPAALLTRNELPPLDPEDTDG